MCQGGLSVCVVLQNALPPLRCPQSLRSFPSLACYRPSQKLKMTNKEKKALKKLRDARRARGEDVTDSEEEL